MVNDQSARADPNARAPPMSEYDLTIHTRANQKANLDVDGGDRELR